MILFEEEEDEVLDEKDKKRISFKEVLFIILF
jgi:hypothetical protein